MQPLPFRSLKSEILLFRVSQQFQSKNAGKIRIAKGSGRTVEEVNRLLKQFDQMKVMMKSMKNGKMPF